MKNILPTIIPAAALVVSTVIVAGVTGAVSFQYFQTQNVVAKNSAIDACLQAGRVSFETTDEETGQITRSELPATDIYETCMTAKGYNNK